jgi:hypothetical protein
LIGDDAMKSVLKVVVVAVAEVKENAKELDDIFETNNDDDDENAVMMKKGLVVDLHDVCA